MDLGMETQFSVGANMLADPLYCNYYLIAAQMKAGVDVLFEQNGSRITDFRRGRQLDQQGRSLAAVCAALACRTRRAQPQDHHRHGCIELPDAADERETAPGSSAGLQLDQASSRPQRRRRPSRVELQAHVAVVDRVVRARALRSDGFAAATHADCPMQGRPTARTHRTTNAKERVETLSIAEGAARSSSPRRRQARSFIVRKVSAIPPKWRGILATEVAPIHAGRPPRQQSAQDLWFGLMPCGGYRFPQLTP